MPAGTATDWPKYPERGLLVDLGRKYFSIDWIRDRIREMSYLKLNYFHLHLSDRQGFRLASERHPEIVSDRHYMKHEIRSLIEYAQRYHVQLVPEIDFPGHMDAILAAHPDLKLVSRKGIVNHGAIDLSKPESYRLMADLLDEYLPLFPASTGTSAPTNTSPTTPTFVDGSKLPGHLGAKVSVWCDEPDAKSEAQIADALRDRLRVLSQLTWGSPKPLLYLLFMAVMNAVG